MSALLCVSASSFSLPANKISLLLQNLRQKKWPLKSLSFLFFFFSFFLLLFPNPGEVTSTGTAGSDIVQYGCSPGPTLSSCQLNKAMMSQVDNPEAVFSLQTSNREQTSACSIRDFQQVDCCERSFEPELLLVAYPWSLRGHCVQACCSCLLHKVADNL